MNKITVFMVQSYINFTYLVGPLCESVSCSSFAIYNLHWFVFALQVMLVLVLQDYGR